MKKRLYTTLLGALLPLLLPTAKATETPALLVEEPGYFDERFLNRQRALVDDLGRTRFGVPVRGNINDLPLLQRILDEDIIRFTDAARLQALGVVLGDVYVAELGLEWRAYTDRQGKSRAVCVKRTHHCLFPVTMISRRVAVGSTPNVAALYHRGVALIQPYHPRLPYSSDLPQAAALPYKPLSQPDTTPPDEEAPHTDEP